ncbi:tRNA pseudouridine(55) synthase TruB [Pseudomonadales bacterium]|nr:tRNA pseudouridine(55) synthase TruB [Pseudomonadales bacterium]
MGRTRRGRLVNGILVLDKPLGVSSNGALQECKRLFFAAKAGHTGSLDPLATGVLPLCFGEATKFSQFLLDADKTYTSTFVLGAKSTTDDADGEITPVADASSLTEQQVLEMLLSFKGEQQQIPPMYSALKHKGERLYKLARKGEEVERPSRDIRIDHIEMTAFRSFGTQRPEIEIDVLLSVSKGTYIRAVASDLGDKLGVGAYVAALRRVQSGPFVEPEAISIETLRELKQDDQFEEMDKLLKPLDYALSHIPMVTLDESSGFYVRRGQPVQVSGAPLNGIVKLILESGEFIGIGEINDDGLVAPKRLVV